MEIDKQQVIDPITTVKLAAGTAGIATGFIDHVVSAAQVISVIGGALIVTFTLIGMAFKGAKRLNKWLKQR